MGYYPAYTERWMTLVYESRVSDFSNEARRRLRSVLPLMNIL